MFGIPSWAIGGSSGDSLTYANTTEQNRALVTHALRPWATRVEKSLSSDLTLFPGGLYCQFDFDGFLRASPEQRADQYQKALDPDTGWMRRQEVRELEDLPPENGDTVNRPTTGSVEERTAPDTAPTVDGRRLHGLIPSGVESRDMGGWREVIDHGALDGSLLIDTRADGTRVYAAKFRDASGRQVKRRIGLVRTPHEPDGFTKAQAEARLRDLMNGAEASTPVEHARTLDEAANAWLLHLEATGAKASSIRAYRAALDKWIMPMLKGPQPRPHHRGRHRGRHDPDAQGGPLGQDDP